MMKQLEEIFKANRIKVFEELKNDFLLKLGQAADLPYAYYQLREQFNKDFNKVQAEATPYSASTLWDIDHIRKLDKNMTFENALQKILKDLKQKEKQEAVIKISNIQAGNDFSRFHYDYSKEHIFKNSSEDNEIQVSELRNEWLGNQKELAELFVELHKKGWIKELNANTIKIAFTKSDSIQQILKPTQDRDTKQPTYEGIYTPSYRPKFDTIRHNSGVNATMKKQKKSLR